MSKLYTYRAVDFLVGEYIDKGGNAVQVNDGTLASGDIILYDYSGKLYNYIIKEVFVNPWSSGQTIRKYKRLPKKYLDIVENWEGGLYEWQDGQLVEPETGKAVRL